jgi:hypothetical protein
MKENMMMKTDSKQMVMKKYKYEGVLPPTFFTSLTDQKKYIVPAWIEVKTDTTINQVEWTKPSFLKNNNNDTTV